jgi:hypothetical protein
MKRLLVLVAVAAALLVAPAAQAWSWGYNYLSPGSLRVSSGWNYWVNQYLDKNSGGTIRHGFITQGGGLCYDFMSGSATHFHSPSDLGCGGYLNNFVDYWSGNSSYLYVSSAS